MNLKKCHIIYNEPGEGAQADELDVLDQVNYIKDHLIELGYSVSEEGITADFMNEIKNLQTLDFDFIFNLVESINNKGELCYFVPALLNMYKMPYSGNPVEAIFLSTSKYVTYKVLQKANINTPACFLPSQYEQLTEGKKYIIKPIWEDGSLGITSDSVFTYSRSRTEEIKSFSDSHWIIQDFIDGREFNISILGGGKGPEIMPAAEMVFHNYHEGIPKIVDFRAKWVEGSFEYENSRRDFPGEKLDPGLKEKIGRMAINCWHEFGLKGYARIDMRVDDHDNPFVIEVNANPCLSPESGFPAATMAAGYDFSYVLSRIIEDINY